MSLEVFNFPYHTVSVENPETGVRIQLGNSYVFTTPPTDPDMRKLTLSFEGMQYYFNDSGVLDDTINVETNMYAMIKFYQRNKLYKSFHYTHPVHGLMAVKFNKPLKEEDVIKGSHGIVKDFSIELVEIP